MKKVNLTGGEVLQDGFQISVKDNMISYGMSDSIEKLVSTKYNDNLISDTARELFAESNEKASVYVQLWLRIARNTANSYYDIPTASYAYILEKKAGETEPVDRVSISPYDYYPSGDLEFSLWSAVNASQNNEVEGTCEFKISGGEPSWPITLHARSFATGQEVSSVTIKKAECEKKADGSYHWKTTDAFTGKLTRHEAYWIWMSDSKEGGSSGQILLVDTRKKSTTPNKPTTPAKVPVLNKTSLDILNGKKVTLSVKNKPKGSTVAYASADTAVATVDVKKGKIVPVATGTTTIVATVTTKIGENTTLECPVKVEKPVLSQNEFYLTVGVEGKDRAVIELQELLPDTDDVLWKSSKPAVVTVDANSGEIKALKAGTAYISTKRNKKTYKAKVVVYDPYFKVSSKKMKTVKVTKNCKLTIKNGAKETSAWESSDESIAVVDGQGKITGIAPGTVTISATNAGKRISTDIQVVPLK